MGGRRVLIFALAFGVACTAAGPERSPSPAGPIRVLVFSGAEGFRHTSIDAAVERFRRIARDGEIAFTFTDDAAALTHDAFAAHDVLVWNNATGETPLGRAQKDAMIAAVREDGLGFVGIHAAADSNYRWRAFVGLVGASFDSHPHASGRARLTIEDPANPLVQGVPDPWVVDEELYRWRRDPRGRVHVLVSLDASSIREREEYARAHPLIWCHEPGRGRAFYTNLGHAEETFDDPVYIGMLVRAIRWASGRIEADCSLD
jgi:type 1 glutamine amidotransferase